MKKILKNLFAVGIAVGMIFTLGSTITAEASENTYFHSEGADSGFRYYLMSYEYEAYGYEFEDVGVNFQTSEDGRYYYVTNPEVVEELLEELRATSRGVDKTVYPTFQKEVGITPFDGKYDENTNTEVTVSDGDTVYFRLTMTKGDETKNYHIYDRIPQELQVNTETVQVSMNGKEIEQANYTLLYDEYRFKDEYIASLTANSKICITYEAKVDLKEVPELSANTSTLEITASGYAIYGQNNTRLDAVGPTVKVIMNRLTLNNDVTGENNLFTNAEFELYDMTDPKNPTKLSLIEREEEERASQASGCYLVKAGGSEETIEMKQNTQVEILGLTRGKSYRLKCIKYQNTDQKVAEFYDFTWEKDASAAQIDLSDFVKPEIVETGGIGTSVFYAAGILLMSVSGMLLLKNKRREEV